MTSRGPGGWLSTHPTSSGCALPTTMAGLAPPSISVSFPESPAATHRSLQHNTQPADRLRNGPDGKVLMQPLTHRPHSIWPMQGVVHVLKQPCCTIQGHEAKLKEKTSVCAQHTQFSTFCPVHVTPSLHSFPPLHLGMLYSERTYSSAASLPARWLTQSTYRQSPTPLMMICACRVAAARHLSLRL